VEDNRKTNRLLIRYDLAADTVTTLSGGETHDTLYASAKGLPE